MKKFLFAAVVAALTLSSCSTVSHTASTEDVNTGILNRTSANLTVTDQRISYTFTPSDAHQRAGMKSMKAAAIKKALEANGNADVLVAPEFEIKKTRGVFTTKVKYITVSGHPATYNNFHQTTQGEANVVNTLNGNAVTCINGAPAPCSKK